MSEPVDLRRERNKRVGSAKDWTVDDALSEATRMRAEEPDSLPAKASRVVIIFGDAASDGSTGVHIVMATKNGWEAMGLLAEATAWIAK